MSSSSGAEPGDPGAPGIGLRGPVPGLKLSSGFSGAVIGFVFVLSTYMGKLQTFAVLDVPIPTTIDLVPAVMRLHT